MFTECCGALFTEGYTDICSSCGEHADAMDIEDTLTEKEKHKGE